MDASMREKRTWDIVAVGALASSLWVALGYVDLIYFDCRHLGTWFAAMGIWIAFPSALHAGWGIYRAMHRSHDRGQWMSWAACLLLFLVFADFVRKFFP